MFKYEYLLQKISKNIYMNNINLKTNENKIRNIQKYLKILACQNEWNKRIVQKYLEVEPASASRQPDCSYTRQSTVSHLYYTIQSILYRESYLSYNTVNIIQWVIYIIYSQYFTDSHLYYIYGKCYNINYMYYAIHTIRYIVSL